MSNSFQRTPDTIIATIGLNDGANKGFWRIQPRDDEGQWIEMGADVLFRFRTGKGNLVVATVRGIYVGPSGKPGRARVLVEEGNEAGLEPGVYDVESRNLKQFKAILPKEAGKGSGAGARKDKFGKPVKTLADNKLPAVSDLLKSRQPITDEDRRLARGELSPAEREAEADGRAKSPVANLPAGFEGANPEATKKLLRESGIEPDEFDPEVKTKKAPAASKSVDSSEEKDEKLQSAVVKKIQENQKVLPSSLEVKGLPSQEDVDKELERVQRLLERGVYIPYRSGARLPANEAYLNNIDEKNTPITLDELLKKVEDLKTGKKKAEDIETGDVILGPDGVEYVVLGVTGDFDEQTKSPTGKYRIKLQAPDGRTTSTAAKKDKEFDVVAGKKGKPVRPGKPEKETVKPESTEVKPEKPVKAPTPPKTPTPPAPPKDDKPFSDPDDLPNGFPPADKIDNGDPITLEPLTDEAREQAAKKKVASFIDKVTGGILQYFENNGKKRPASDPFELLDALSAAYPNAKFSKDGNALILDRRVDKDGRVFELRAYNSGSKAIIYAMRWTDTTTGEFEEVIHIDKRHSIRALFRKDNGPDGLMARLLSNETLEHGRKGSKSIPAGASLRERAEWFIMKQKLFTSGNLATFYGNGRQAIFHKDGALKNQEVPPVMDAYMDFEANPSPETQEALYHRLMSLFGRIPMTESAHKEARTALRAEFKRLYPEVNMRSMGAYITNASRLARGLTYDVDPAVRSNPFASKDRATPIEPGMTIEYTNNVGEKAVLKVVGFAPTVGVVRGKDGDDYDYDDYIYAKDSKGKTYRVNAIKARILRNQEEALSEYKPNLELSELRRKRAALGLYGVAGDAVPPRVAGTSSVAKDAPPPLPDIVDDLIEGDILPNFKEGGDVGEIIKTRFVTTKSGEEAIAFTVVTPEGEEMVVVHRLGKEIPKKA